MQQREFDALMRKLDLLIVLLLRSLPRNRDSLTLREQIGILDGLGVGPTEIGRIIGRPAKYVTKELAEIRRGRAKKEGVG